MLPSGLPGNALPGEAERMDEAMKQPMPAADHTSPHLRRIGVALCGLLLVAFAVTWGAHVGAPYSFDHDEGVYLMSARMVMLGDPLFTAQA